MDSTSKPLRPEWSYRLEADQVTTRATKLSISATPQERKDLARRLRVADIETLGAEITAQREPGSTIIHIEGRVTARIVQNCITTRQPVAEEVSETFESWYADPAQAVPFVKARREKLNRGERDMEVLPERDDPDLVTDGFIDVAELAAQYLSLGINPYPRAADEPPIGAEPLVMTAGAARRNPFAALKDWKARQGGEN